MVRFSRIMLFCVLILSYRLYAQEPDINRQLTDINNGNISKVKKDLVELKQKYPKSPSVMYLDALLTENGEEAIGKYSAIVENYPKNKYADDALYKVYSYYYASGAYRMADGYLQQLKDTYPQSEYIKIAEETAEGKETENIHSGNNQDVNNTAQKKSIPAAKNSIKDEDFKYTIQAGAFISLNNARNLKKSLETAGYFSEIKEKNVGGSILNIVNVGKYMAESEAKSELISINKTFNLEGRVVPIN